MLLSIKVTPRSSKTEIVGWEGDVLKIRLHAIPEKNEANQELEEFLSEILKIARSRIKVVHGFKSRLKKVAIEGLSPSELKEMLVKE